MVSLKDFLKIPKRRKPKISSSKISVTDINHRKSKFDTILTEYNCNFMLLYHIKISLLIYKQLNEIPGNMSFTMQLRSFTEMALSTK